MTPTDKDIADAIAALEPFASVSNQFEPDEGDDDIEVWLWKPTIGHLRRAAHAKASLEAVRDAKPAPDVTGERAIFNPPADHPQALPFADVRAMAGREMPALPPVAGMETSEASRYQYLSLPPASIMGRLARDIDRLIAALAEARAENAKAHQTFHDEQWRALKEALAERDTARADAKKAREEERIAVAVWLELQDASCRPATLAAALRSHTDGDEA